MAIARFKPQFRRLLFIEHELRKGQYPNCSSLSREWEVSARTIHRDMDYLRDELDAPIEYSEKQHGYFLSDTSWTLQSVVLEEGEVLSLLIGTQVAGMFEGTPVAAQLAVTYDKLKHLLPDKVTIDPALVFNKFSFQHAPSRSIDTTIWQAVVRALLHQDVVSITYSSHRSSKPKQHVMHPYHAANIEGEWYVFGYSERWDDIVQYAIGRIVAVELAGRTFTIPETVDIPKLLTARTGRFVETENEKTWTLRLRFAPAVATYISERTWHPQQQLKRRRDGSIDLAFPVNTFIGIISWILGFGEDVEVLGPKSLRECVADRVFQAASLYQSDGA